MAWISYGGRTGAAILENRRRRGANEDDASHSDEDGGGGGGGASGGRAGGLQFFKGVPLCGAGSCTGPGLPPKRLPRPGIDCVNGDQPCLPCDIVNLRLRVAVTGSHVKRAVAECQKRYFCRVWNLLFAHLFPKEHRRGTCPDLKANDPLPRCSGQPQKARRNRTWTRRPSPEPILEDPFKALKPVEDMRMTDHKVRKKLPPQPPARPAQPKARPAMKKARQAAPLPLLPPKAPLMSTPKKARKRGGLVYNLTDYEHMKPESLKKHNISHRGKNFGFEDNFYGFSKFDSKRNT